MKPSHLSAPRSLAEATFNPSGEAFDWTEQPKRLRPWHVLAVIVVVLLVFGASGALQ